jgi:hypothetical protein
MKRHQSFEDAAVIIYTRVSFVASCEGTVSDDFIFLTPNNVLSVLVSKRTKVLAQKRSKLDPKKLAL